MALTWHREENALWDEDKKRIIGGAPDDIVDIDPVDGEALPGHWWCAKNDGAVVGYGCLDSAWGDAEIALVVDTGAQRKGVGSFVLENLEHEAAAQGVNYVYNTVHAKHPKRTEVQGWLKTRGFLGDDREEFLRKNVSSAVPSR